MSRKTRKHLPALLLAAASLALSTASLQAVVYVETGDAGQSLATAQAAGTFTGTATGLTGISGTIAGTNGLDADLYSFSLSTATSLRFVSSSSAGIDTSVFLFNSTGVALLANDDQSGTNIAGAFSTGLLTAGTYYFGISLSGNEPINNVGQLLFTADQPTTNVRTAAANVSPATLSTFNGGTFIAEGGAYAISISAVPEPSTWALLGFGGIASLAFLRRARRPQAN